MRYTRCWDRWWHCLICYRPRHLEDPERLVVASPPDFPGYPAPNRHGLEIHLRPFYSNSLCTLDFSLVPP